MIYISSSCIKSKRIGDAVKLLAKAGFSNIELSGGTNYYSGYIDHLIELKKEYNLSYIIHNYFPPPQKHMVINLASLNNDVYRKSIEHVNRAIELAKKLDIDKIGVHAGFLIDPSINELGKPFASKSLFNKKHAIQRFCDAVKILKKNSGNISIYIENNVYSLSNYNTFKDNLCLFTNYDDLQELYEFVDFSIILDVAHLKVSCNTLKLDFETHLNSLINLSHYIHLSDNDGFQDSNHKINENSYLLNVLNNYDFRNKIVTLEIYESLNAIKSSFDLILSIIN